MTFHEYTAADRFTVGTVGDVGSRVFLLQATQGTRRLTIKVEKQQVAVLATYLTRAIKDLGRPGHLPDDLEIALSPDDLIDFIAGNLSVAIDDEAGVVQVMIEEIGDEGEGDSATITVSREQAAAFAIRATLLVEAGRPPCPLCGFPLDPSGHDCPRTNGHRAPKT